MNDQATSGADGGDTPAAAAAKPHTEPVATVGTGTFLGIGCVGIVLVAVIIALIVRWLTGVW